MVNYLRFASIIYEPKTNLKCIILMDRLYRLKYGPAAVNRLLKKVTNLEAENEVFLHQTNHFTILDQFHLHHLYVIIKRTSLTKSKEQTDKLINQLPLLTGLQCFVQIIMRESLGYFAEISDHTIQEIIELIQMNVSVKRERVDLKQRELEISKNILENIYNLILQSKRSQLFNPFLECLSIIRKESKNQINEQIYSELLCKTISKHNEFIQFFQYYIGKPEEKMPCVLENLFRGLSLRLNVLLEKDQYKNQLILIYVKITDFLKAQPRDSIWLELLLRNEYSNIFETLLLLITKRFNFLKLAYIFNNLIQIYLKAQMSNITRFQFVLNIFKFIIQRSNNFYALISTDQLAEKDFLYWFVNRELKIQKSKDIISQYMSNPQSIEFLLIIMIYYMDRFPDKVKDMEGLMRSINLLEQAKYFILYKNVSQLMSAFYSILNEFDEFDEFRNRISDQYTMQQFLDMH